MVSSAFSVYVIHYTGVFFGYLSVKTCKISVYVREDQSMNQSMRIRRMNDAEYHRTATALTVKTWVIKNQRLCSSPMLNTIKE